ncbi:hypothetical protein MAPG_04209 [Magnaporthiopsis poae ATCC 64411]|uniref:Uncharacterized protein n=1 Tax=Magnaporthiopsis poae (strain ATCC 64411 / 73-15) TaxID=644358 RepID=A0A0C4DW38_MAGP6|nr:hypothetical protein MAPG_04209 [Magnaporthiopsis poae ATCC 64411]
MTGKGTKNKSLKHSCDICGKTGSQQSCLRKGHLKICKDHPETPHSAYQQCVKCTTERRRKTAEEREVRRSQEGKKRNKAKGGKKAGKKAENWRKRPNNGWNFLGPLHLSPVSSRAWLPCATANGCFYPLAPAAGKLRFFDLHRLPTERPFEFVINTISRYPSAARGHRTDEPRMALNLPSDVCGKMGDLHGCIKKDHMARCEKHPDAVHSTYQQCVKCTAERKRAEREERESALAAKVAVGPETGRPKKGKKKKKEENKQENKQAGEPDGPKNKKGKR